MNSSARTRGGEFRTDLARALAIPQRVREVRAVRALLARERRRIRAAARGRLTGLSAVLPLTEMVDILLHALWDRLERGASPRDRTIALVAIGGYGRRELCPGSDLDLLLLTSDAPAPEELRQAETLVRDLWDYGFEVGSQVSTVREVEEVLLPDPPARTALLSERFLAGNFDLYRRFWRAFNRALPLRRTRALVSWNLEERRRRLERQGSLIQMLQPNLKEGPGGLRDVHCLLWIARWRDGSRDFDDLVRHGTIGPQDAGELREAWQFLLRVRACLHFVEGRKTDVLGFHLQPATARELGFQREGRRRGVDNFLRALYRHQQVVNRITGSLLAAWEGQDRGRRGRPLAHPAFADRRGVLELRSPTGNPFHGRPELMLDFFDLANRHDLAYGTHALGRMRQAVRVLRPGALRRPLLIRFLELCRRPHRVGRMLRAMHETGFIELVVPDFRLIHCHATHSMYHIYTTDEHTLTVLRQLAYLPGSVDAALAPLRAAHARVMDHDILLLACLFHDLGKGLPGEHSQTGARLAYRFLRRAGFSPARCEEAARLVRHHLFLNETAQRRALDDPQTLRDVLARVEDAQTLHKLYILTYCDISSVHPDAWSAWKASLLHELYERALAELDPGAVEARPEAALVSLAEHGEHLRGMPPRYLFSTGPAEVARHAAMAAELRGTPAAVRLVPGETHHQLSVVARDRPGLLTIIAGALAGLGLSVLSARIFTRSDGVAVDEFKLAQAAGAGDDLSRLEARLRERIRQALEGRVPAGAPPAAGARPARRAAAFPSLHVPPDVHVSNIVSAEHTAIDISCPDRLGLLATVTGLLAELGLNIHAAVLTTEADAALDSFYVTAPGGGKLTDPSRIALVRQRLKEKLIDRRHVKNS